MTRIAIVLLAMGLSLTALMGDDNIIILPEKSGAKGERGKILTKKPLEFTIPQIDLDKREDLQVIISRYKDMYCGHPSCLPASACARWRQRSC